MSPQTTDDLAQFLLLLPPVTELSWAAVHSQYEDTIRQVLGEVATAFGEQPRGPILDIALACPHLTKTTTKAFGRYHETQRITSLVYRLICVIAGKAQINIEDAEGIDVRIILIAWKGKDSHIDPDVDGEGVISLQQLAASQRPWQYAFGVESETGEAFVGAFVSAKGSLSGDHPISDGSRGRGPSSRAVIRQPQPCVAVGGTFDHLHIGHKLLLTLTIFAAVDRNREEERSTSVIVGITGDELLQNKKFAEQLESWHVRQEAVYGFIRGIVDFAPPGTPEPESSEVHKSGPNGHAVDIQFPSGLLLRCVEIADPFGPTITEKDIDALIISGETRSGGKAVNDKRGEHGWPPLEVLEVDVLDATAESDQRTTEATDFSGKISSTEIRKKLSAAKKGSSSVL